MGLWQFGVFAQILGVRCGFGAAVFDGNEWFLYGSAGKCAWIGYGSVLG